MSKITLLVSQKRISEALVALRKLGLIHVQHMQKPTAHHITDIEHKLATVERVLSIVSEYDGKEKEIRKNDIPSCLKEIVSLNNQRQTFKGRKLELEKRLVWFDTWGNVSGSSLAELKSKGVHIRLYICDRKVFKKLSEDRLIYIIRDYGSRVCIAHVSTLGEQVLDLPEVAVPSENLHSLQKKIGSAKRDLEITERKLAELALYKKSFFGHKKELKKGLEFCKVKFGMNAEAGVSMLEGFCPKESLPEIEKAAKEQGWAFVTQEPDGADKVPTLIRYPAWVKVIKPLFNLMGTLPGYKEYDISPWFLLFFSLFFAMLIGDAGYGCVFLIATFFARKKMPKAPALPFFLMYTLSGATIAWGAITGNWFGIERVAQLPFLGSLVVDNLNAFADTNQAFSMQLCFILAASQLSLAHSLVAIRHSNSLKSLAQVGWICIIWGIYNLVSTLVFNKPFPVFAKYLLVSGMGIVILFSNFQKNILKGLAIGIANLPLKFINSFADTLSYLRLFAIGYVSVMMAASFNEMALSVGFNGILRTMISVLILLGGHALNIALGLMSVLVHGLRLNMLEFSGHLDMEWSGVEYKPFKE